MHFEHIFWGLVTKTLKELQFGLNDIADSLNAKTSLVAHLFENENKINRCIYALSVKCVVAF